MVPIFLKRFLAGLVLLAVSLLAFYFAPRQGKNNYWYKPHWMRAGALYWIGGITLVGGSILVVTAIMEWLGRW